VPYEALAFQGGNGLLGLVQGTQAAAAHVQASGGLSILDSDLLNVGQPAPLRSRLGMAYAVAKLGPFAADIAFDWHLKLPLF
jgi:hypothetical protein